MQDQVSHLLELGIAALFLSSDNNAKQRDFAFSGIHFITWIDMSNPELYSPATATKLVYVTPEMTVKSMKFQQLLQYLHKHKRLAR